MAVGISALGRTQLGIEAIAGGSTDPATVVWMGSGMMKDNLRQVFPRQKNGILGGTSNSYISETGGGPVLEGEWTFEQGQYVLNSAIKHVDPTTDAGSAKIRTWDVQATSTDPISTTDLDTLVVEIGDNIQAEIARYAFVTDFTLSQNSDGALAVTANLLARAPAPGSFTAGLTPPTVETILFGLGGVYIDDTTGTIGSTLISQTLLDMSLKHTTGWVAKKAKDNRLDFSFIKRIDDEILIDVTFEHNSIAVVEKAAWRSKTERALRLEYLGTALSTTDTYGNKAFIINAYGKWDTFGAAGLEEEDGNNVYKGTFRVRYSTVASAKMSYVMVNEVA